MANSIGFKEILPNILYKDVEFIDLNQKRNLRNGQSTYSQHVIILVKLALKGSTKMNVLKVR